MQRISAILRESEAMAVRKAVCAEGAARVVITPLPYWMCGADMVDIYSEKRMRELNKQVLLDVTADDSRSCCIVSAIRKIVHAARIVMASSHGKITRGSRSK